MYCAGAFEMWRSVDVWVQIVEVVFRMAHTEASFVTVTKGGPGITGDAVPRQAGKQDVQAWGRCDTDKQQHTTPRKERKGKNLARTAVGSSDGKRARAHTHVRAEAPFVAFAGGNNEARLPLYRDCLRV